MIFVRHSRSASAWRAMTRIIYSARSTCLTSTIVWCGAWRNGNVDLTCLAHSDNRFSWMFGYNNAKRPGPCYSPGAIVSIWRTLNT